MWAVNLRGEDLEVFSRTDTGLGGEFAVHHSVLATAEIMKLWLKKR